MLEKDDMLAIKQKIEELSEDQYKTLSEKFQTETKQNLENVVKHLQEPCNDSECDITKATNEIEDNAFALGFLVKELTK